jgi:hypothetical protein
VGSGSGFRFEDAGLMEDDTGLDVGDVEEELWILITDVGCAVIVNV